MSKKKKDSSCSNKNDEYIKELLAENSRLKKENAALKDELHNKSAVSFGNKDKAFSALRNQAKTQKAFSQKKYFSYLRELIKNASFFRAYSVIINSVKKFTFISTSLKVLVFILSTVHSGAVFLISTSAFIVSLPFSLLISGASFILTFIGSRKSTKRIRPLIAEKKVYALFPSRKQLSGKSAYLTGFVNELAQDENSAVIIVSPFFFSQTGVSESKKAFASSRFDGKNTVIVRRHYYFTLKQKVILKNSNNLVEIY